MKLCSGLFLTLFLLLFIGASAQKPVVLKSPDGKLVFSFKLPDGHAMYSVSYKGKQLIGDSEMGFVFQESGTFGHGLKSPKVVFSKVDDRYDLVVGKTKTCMRSISRYAFRWWKINLRAGMWICW
jgi:alpha-glucosidase